MNGSILDLEEVAWHKLPDDLKRQAVDYLREQLPADYLLEVKEMAEGQLGDWSPYPGWHFDGGMSIRNLLRQVIKDSELPGLPEFYGVDHGGNWDDYYVPCLEAAAGLREI